MCIVQCVSGKMLGQFDVLFILSGFIIVLWNYVIYKRKYFERHGVKTLPYSVPFIGHIWKNILQKEHIKETVDRLYKAFPHQRYIGFQQLTTSVIMIKDLELIKQLTIKDFDHLENRITSVEESVDPIFGGILVALKGQKWHDMRSTLSPAFTSSKMKGMFQFIEECAHQTVEYLKKEIKTTQNDTLSVEMKILFKKYTNDVIASSAFGLKVNSLEDPKNPFYIMGSKAMDFSGIRLLKFLFGASCPKTFVALGLRITDESINTFYRKLMKNTINERVEKNITRPDMVHLLMEAKKGMLEHENTDSNNDTGFSTVEESALGKKSPKRKWTDDEITAQAVLFLIAGFDTTSSALSFLVYELTLNSDIQRRLQNEIDEVTNKLNGELTYAELNKMKYLDMVVSETLRKWPPFVFIDRKCVKPYTLPYPSNGSDKQFRLEVDQGIQIPIYSIHRDPKYYKDPEKFDPERFSESRKHEIIPYSYLPFGIGPRNCIGSRFALMETKVIVFYLLKNFDFVSVDKTENPLPLKKNVFSLNAENGFWIGLKLRTL